MIHSYQPFLHCVKANRAMRHGLAVSNDMVFLVKARLDGAGMDIVCNGEPREVESGTSVATFLGSLGVNSATAVVECDGVILQREAYERHLLRDGMVLEVIRFVGGGASC